MQELSNDLKTLHVLNRLGFGPRKGDLAHARSLGFDGWISAQLHPDSIPIPPELNERLDAMPTLGMSPLDLYRKYGIDLVQKRKAAKAAGDKDKIQEIQNEIRQVHEQAVAGRLIRALFSPRQLYEVMTDFWFNHFNVVFGKGLDNIWTGSYEQLAIRPHVFGKFRTLLGATAKHPAMLFYLDNWQNTAPGSPGAHGELQGLNENYAREVMELHTLGVDGGYTQQDVIALARILTGWGFVPAKAAHLRTKWWKQPAAPYEPNGFYFDSSRHDMDDKRFLGTTIRGSGIDEGETALDMLARSPATAHHLSFQLCQYFVSDNPPDGLVKRIASRFLETDGDIRSVLEAIFTSPEFFDRRHYAVKFKTPYQYIISAVRASAVSVRNFAPLAGAMAQLGMPLYGCQTPDGWKNTQVAWLNPDAMIRRIGFATALGTGKLPLEAAEGAKPRPVKDMAPPVGPDPSQIAIALGNHFSSETSAAVEAAPERLRAALMLGSPDFMMR